MAEHNGCEPVVSPADTLDPCAKATELYETILNTVDMFNWAMDAHNNVLKSAVELLEGNGSDLMRAADFVELARREFLSKVDHFYIRNEVEELARMAGWRELSRPDAVAAREEVAHG